MARLLIRALIPTPAAKVACGGGDDSAAPQFPSVAGTYVITGTFDDLPGATVSGPLTLVQADRSSNALSGAVTLTLRTATVGARPLRATVSEALLVVLRLIGCCELLWQSPVRLEVGHGSPARRRPP